MYYAAIDLGGTFLKSALLDVEALQVVAFEREPFPSFEPGLPAEQREIDPTKILAAARRALTRVLRLVPECRGLVVCGQMHGVILTDSEGRPLSRFISWQDQRSVRSGADGESSLGRLREAVGNADRRALGNEMRAGLPIATLSVLREEGSLPGGAVPLSLGDFVTRHLGEASGSPSCDPSNAAAHGTFDVGKGTWHDGVLRRLGLDTLSWPRVTPFPKPVARIPSDTGGFPVFAPVGDHQCAILGSLLREGELSINAATGSQVSRLVYDATISDAFQVRPFFDGLNLRTVTHLPAGRALRQIVRLLKELAPSLPDDDAWRVLLEKASGSSQDDVHVDLSFFASTHGGRGSISNLHEGNVSAGALMRGALDCMAASYEVASRALFPDTEPASIVYSGGLAHRIPLLRELVSRRLPYPSRTAPSSEDTLVGLLLLALVASRRCDSVQEALSRARDATSRSHAWLRA